MQDYTHTKWKENTEKLYSPHWGQRYTQLFKKKMYEKNKGNYWLKHMTFSYCYYDQQSAPPALSCASFSNEHLSVMGIIIGVMTLSLSSIDLSVRGLSAYNKHYAIP